MWKRTPRGSDNARSGRRRPARRPCPIDLARPELLDRRILPAVTISFSSQGVLTVIGDAANNNLQVSRNATGAILVNGQTVTDGGVQATVANTSLIQLFGLGGNDTLFLNENRGALPHANLFGGAGNDILVGGSGADLLFGQADDDTLIGGGGDDLLFGGDGNDLLTGGAGNDQVFGQAGNDQSTWNPGDGSDLVESGDGDDTLTVNGDSTGETFTIVANGTRVRLDRVSPNPFNLDIGTTEKLIVNANGGDDTITAGNGLAALIQLSLNGGAGNDTIRGGDGNDLLQGGIGDDTIFGGRGNDTALMGDGDDTFVWNPGDGSDTVEGQAGNDTLDFNGANVNESIDVSANGSRVRLTRNIANITMDLNGVEGIDLATLGGADTITVGDMAGTDLKRMNVDLAATGGAGDGQVDTVIVNGTGNADNMAITGSGSGYTVSGLPALVSVTGSEGANDALVLNALGGDDTINASSLPAGVARLTIDAGAGNDTIRGSQGNDVLVGGLGNDTIDGNQGTDVAFMGDGDDTFIWDPGDGSDTIEGQAGNDTLVFNGSNAGERFDVSANGGRVRFFRDVANITMDLDDVEGIDLAALGGADTVTVGDMSGTDLARLDIDLAATGGAGDAQADAVVVNGTNNADHIVVAGSPSGVTISGLPTLVQIVGIEAASDTLTINGQGGADTIDASGLKANVVGLVLNGGNDDDFLIGSQGNDTIIGGRGSDTALMGGGDDTFVWNPGDGSDIVEGQAGTDRLVFNGANINERLDVSANGSRVRLTRDVAAITMDLNDVEGIDLATLGGADTVTVGDMSGTDLAELNIDLSSPPGSGLGDGQADTVIVNGTSSDDTIAVAGDANGVAVIGLATRVNIRGAEAANDRLVVNALGGDDVVTATGLSAPAIALTANGGDGDDVIIGGAGNDTLTGGAGDDILIGGPGQDILDGGSGSNVLIQD